MDTVHYIPPRGHARSARRAQGAPTRGKTAANRLRRVDHFVLLYRPELVDQDGGPTAPEPLDQPAAPSPTWFVDVGYGDEPTTTLESAERFRQRNPDLAVLGVEIDRERVKTAEPFTDDRTHFRHGGFNLPVGPPGDGSDFRIRLIRCFNVLRQYDESAVMPAWETMTRYLAPGGLLLEGTSTPNGSLFVANLLGRAEDGAGFRHLGFAFSHNLRRPFDPGDFKAVLPKNLIHRVVLGEPVHAFLAAWSEACRRAAHGQLWGPRWMWRQSVRSLAGEGYPIDWRAALVDRGFLVVRRLDRNE